MWKCQKKCVSYTILIFVIKEITFFDISISGKYVEQNEQVFTDVLCHVHYDALDNLKKEKECFVWNIFKDYKIYFSLKRKCEYLFETFKIWD